MHRRQGINRRQQDTKHDPGVSQNQLCFVHIFLRTGMLYNCYQDGTFSIAACPWLHLRKDCAIWLHARQK